MSNTNRSKTRENLLLNLIGRLDETEFRLLFFIERGNHV